jgi:very-short-patch-repair endonuclease
MEIFNCKESKEKRCALRKNLTEAEKTLWKKLRGKRLEGLKFFRQYGIGAYIADFYCPQRKLVIEVDGGQHFSEEGKDYDAQREHYMNSLGIYTLRFSNLDILKNLDGTWERIIQKVKELPLTPSFQKRGNLEIPFFEREGVITMTNKD